MFLLADNNWTCYDFKPQNITQTTVIVESLSQSILIDNTEDLTVSIDGKKGKLAAISNSKKINIILNCSLLSSFSITNCGNVEIQVNSSVPSFIIENSEKITLIFTADFESLKSTSFFTSKSSELNINHKKSAISAEFTEIFIPEQYVSIFKDDGTLLTQPVKHFSS